MSARTFSKPALDLAGQIAHLRVRGLAIPDEDEARTVLKAVGFYRFCGYALHWRLKADGTKEAQFLPGITFRDVTRLCDFDRKLRTHILHAVERIEVALRAAFSNSLGVAYGSHWYLDASRFAPGYKHAELIGRIQGEIHHDQKRADKRDVFIQHYYGSYDNPDMPPAWMVFEAINLGTMSKMFANLNRAEQKLVAAEFGEHPRLVKSWLEMLTVLRNYCAHHARVWNRQFPVKPVIPKLYAPYFEYQMENRKGETVTEIGDFRLHTQLFVLQKFLELIAAGTPWMDQLFDLLHEYGDIPTAPMGFPDKWVGFPTEEEMTQEAERRKAAAKEARLMAKAAAPS
ncbi:Abi family protein [Azospirillum rugosum]|uniref:Abortive infection bacteriophage resistance protein n=1 Tax=Azospirillum rugosum TaxID=416170 RepID=A0ABS4SX02_9PROT|nr:Abi family protein [Azospirillum rugosum]MBP2297093.1 abortive infection bacteriophage resistance protein [Azospirillum rugosum]MDQ0530941.1 abortive infection bacteriophage resistance protein [Azospirillum rugosum]